MFDGLPALTPMRDLRIAVAFLTRLPSGHIRDLSPGALADAAWAFPLVGLIVGGVAGGVLYVAAGQSLGPLVCALAALVVQALITGALHEDGLADVADGLGAVERVRALEIMRDSRIGSFGVLALIFSVGLRAAALSGVAGPGAAWAAMMAAAIFSRAVLPGVMTALPTARSDGLSHGAGAPTMTAAALSLTLGVIALIVLLPWKAALAGILLAAAATIAAAMWAKRKLGGQTGDVLGAIQQLCECAVLIGAAGWSLNF